MDGQVIAAIIATIGLIYVSFELYRVKKREKEARN